MRIRILFPLLIVLIAGDPVFAQREAPCSTPEFRQFDFWVGEWEVSWPTSASTEGKAGSGTNRIHIALDKCVIVENFDGTPNIPLRGMSVSIYNVRKKKWQQTWVDNSGAYLEFTGEFENGKMVLVREALTPDGKKILQRLVWRNLQPDSLDWSWERSDDNGTTWRVLWTIHYERKKVRR